MGNFIDHPVTNSQGEKHHSGPAPAKVVDEIHPPYPPEKGGCHHQREDQQEEGRKNDKAPDREQDLQKTGYKRHSYTANINSFPPEPNVNTGFQGLRGVKLD